jgi:hypothetical protein
MLFKALILNSIDISIFELAVRGPKHTLLAWQLHSDLQMLNVPFSPSSDPPVRYPDWLAAHVAAVTANREGDEMVRRTS